MITISEIQDADVDLVVALWRACDLTRPWNDPYLDIADARTNPISTVLVARDETGSVVGSALAAYDGHRGWLYYVAVAPDLHGNGIGRDLVETAEQWLRTIGARKVQLMVRTTNLHIVGFYEHLGYTDQSTTVLGRWF